MKIKQLDLEIKYLYHYTLKKNVDKILKDKAIISKDKYVFFTKSLSDSINLFEQEMMEENRLYIDVDGAIKRRKKCNKEDYCILKIPYKKDNNFCKFVFDNQSKNSVYTTSIAHKGNYEFEKAKVLEFPKINKINKLTKLSISTIAISILLSPRNIWAANWLDSNNYDINWYTSLQASNTYFLTTPKELAGLAHLVNNEGVTFEGKVIHINDNIDLTSNTWETIDEIFRGEICGSHRILLNYIDGDFIENKVVDIVDYSFPILLNGNLSNIRVKSPYTVLKLKESINSCCEISFDNIMLLDNQSLFDLNINDDKMINVNLIRKIYVKNEEGEKVPLDFESGDSIASIKQKYSSITNIKQDRLIFKYNDVYLEDGRTLADYNIQKCSVIDVYVKEEQKVETNNKTNIVIDNPNTGDNIIKYFIVFVMSIITLIVLKFKNIIKSNKKNQ